jgi:hypothetical protein
MSHFLEEIQNEIGRKVLYYDEGDSPPIAGRYMVGSTGSNTSRLYSGDGGRYGHGRDVGHGQT